MTTYDIRILGQQPIDGALPAGNDVRDDPLYEAVEAEIAKLSSPVHSASIQWEVVTQLCTELLATKGKDLMVACYLTGGLYETRSLRGLAEGLTVVADMLQTYWDTLYPPIKRIRGRRNAVQWLMDRLQQRASEPAREIEPSPVDNVPDFLRNREKLIRRQSGRVDPRVDGKGEK